MNLKKFCGGEEFFNATRVLNSTYPSFSNCFQDLVLDLAPTAFLWLFAIPYFAVFRKTYGSVIGVSKLFVAKVVFTLLMWIVAWADLGRGIWEWIQKIDVSYAALLSPLVVGLGMATAVFFINFDRSKGVRSSGLLTCYWLIFFIAKVLAMKGTVDNINSNMTTGELWRCITFYISYAIVAIQMILSVIVDRPPPETAQDPFSDAAEDLLHERNAEKKLKPCPEMEASFLSRMIFGWFTKMILTGSKRPLVGEDLWELNTSDKSSRVSTHFLKNWNAEKVKAKRSQRQEHPTEASNIASSDEEILIQEPGEKKIQASLLKAMLKTFGPFFLFSSFLKLINDILTFVGPQLLGALIVYTTSFVPVWHGYVLAVLLFVTAIFQSVVLQQYFHICFIVGMRLRSAIVTAVYRKALVITNSVRKESTVGEVVNLMSVDAQRFMDLMSSINILWSGPFQIILAMYFLFLQLGASSLAGFGVMILFLCLNNFIASKSQKLQIAKLKYKNNRIKVMNEVLKGTKVTSMFALNMSFKDKIMDLRKKELDQLKKAACLNAVASFSWVSAPFVVSLVTFAFYVLSDPHHVLDAQKAFVSISLFNILRFPLMMLPVMGSSLVQANVSLKRLQKFLSHDELDRKNVDRNPYTEAAIKIENGTFSWGNDEEPVLSDVSLKIEKGSLVAVVGQVGSGKTSLISALLGDMEKEDGYVSVKGSVAYVAQQAWIQNMTVRDNILFGAKLDVCKYQDTVEACELKEDFEMLPGGDQTEVGERGVNLSGGQKQRVSIARAVYQDSQIYLFDDPLSAVDSHVGKNIFDNVLGPRGCLKTKTRILVTHGVSFLPQVDKIVVLVDGRITEVGNYYELLDKNGAFAEFLRNYAENNEVEEDNPTVDSEESARVAHRKLERQRSRKSVSKQAVYGPTCKRVPLKKKDSEQVCKLPAQKQQEDKLRLGTKTGNAKLSTFKPRKKVIVFFTLVALFYAMQSSLSVYASIWLSQWSNDPLNPDGTQNSTGLRLGVYGALGLGQALVVFASAFAFSFRSVVDASRLHSKILQVIFRAPMSSLNTPSFTRIMNKFRKNVHLMEEVTPRSILSYLNTYILILSALVVIVLSTPILGGVILPILIIYWCVQRFCFRTSFQLKRLELVSRSPIYSHFSETMSGVCTIRAFGLQTSFTNHNEAKIDKNQMAYYPHIASNRWLAVRLDIIGNLIVLFVAIFTVMEKGKFGPGVVGLSISCAMQMTMILNWMVGIQNELKTLKEYTNVQQKALLNIEGRDPGSSWPQEGGLRFDNHSTRYGAELDLVVKNINVNIRGGEKVGIVGRTGAVKSSLTSALFRIIESDKRRIVIDGQTIQDMGLADLRSKVSIIPQNPVLFSGPLRMNLDRFGCYTDNQLWDALEHTHLKSFVTSLPNKLEHEVSDGGENLSVGQRQLVCLARTLLRRSKILVFNEGTAAVDLETADLIQKTIRERFADCIIFTIAHRLNTIMDSTRVMVLDAGKLVEFDSPAKLLESKGIFYSMAKDAGLAA